MGLAESARPPDAPALQQVQQDEDTAAAGGAGVEGVEDDMASLMSYPEFTEACAALAVYKVRAPATAAARPCRLGGPACAAQIPNPYLPIAQRLHDFITKMVMTRALKKRLGQQSTKKHRASVHSQDTDQ